MELEQAIVEIRDGLKNNQFISEASVSQGIVLRLLAALNWPVYDTSIVEPEYKVGSNRRVDYALHNPHGKPIVFVEVKNVGQGGSAGERQLFEYAFHRGVQIAILTDGREWNFFLPAESGDYSDRCVYKLDLEERDLEDCQRRLYRYLQHERVVSGEAIDRARADLRDKSRRRKMELALPVAWEQLVDEVDELLLEMVAERAGNICGFKPSNEIVANFLKNNIYVKGSSTNRTKPPTKKRNQGWIQLKTYNPPPNTNPPSAIQFWDDTEAKINKWSEVLTLVVSKIYSEQLISDSDIPIQFGTRTYLVNFQPVHPTGKEFAHYVEIGDPPLYVNTNLNAGQIRNNTRKLIEHFAPHSTDVYLRLD